MLAIRRTWIVVLLGLGLLACSNPADDQGSMIIVPNDQSLESAHPIVPEGAPTVCLELAESPAMLNLGSALALRFDDRQDALDVIRSASEFLRSLDGNHVDGLAATALATADALDAFLADDVSTHEIEAVEAALLDLGDATQDLCDFG